MTESNGTEAQSGKKSKIIIILLVILLVLSLLFGGILLGALLTGDDSFLAWLGITSGKQPSGGLLVDLDTGKVTPVINQTSQPGVVIPGWGTITFPAGERETDFRFYNPEANNGTYKLQFELVIIDTTSASGYKSLYKTEQIMPGYYENVTLASPLDEKKNYDAVVYVQPYCMDGSPTNNAVMKTTLIVE